MLADGVEAKARADNPHDEAAIEQLVRWVIQDRLNRGQLDRTDLTLKDLDTIRRSLTVCLKGIYHPRLRYPGRRGVRRRPAPPSCRPPHPKT